MSCMAFFGVAQHRPDVARRTFHRGHDLAADLRDEEHHTDEGGGERDGDQLVLPRSRCCCSCRRGRRDRRRDEEQDDLDGAADARAQHHGAPA